MVQDNAEASHLELYRDSLTRRIYRRLSRVHGLNEKANIPLPVRADRHTFLQTLNAQHIHKTGHPPVTTTERA